jgi:outer membrane protein OmpA-like peptidoglycan-associated protein
MKENPRMRIEIAGHTDNVGTYEYNQKLSNGRAKAIYDYLVKAGIDASRMTYKGYAYDKPVADNATEEGRALNRRTEFTIIGF